MGPRNAAGTMVVTNQEEAPPAGTVVLARSSGDGGDYLAALRNNASQSSG